MYDDDDYYENHPGFGLSLLIVVLACFGLMLLHGITAKSYDEDRLNNVETRKIQSSKQDSDNFVLCCNGSNYYIYIKGQSGYRLQIINARYVEIVPTDSISPCIKGHFTERGEIYTPEKAKEIEADCNNSNRFSEEMSNYVIYVPKNYVIASNV